MARDAPRAGFVPALLATGWFRTATSRCSSRTLGTDQRLRVARRGLWGPISDLALLVADSRGRSATSRCSSRTLGTDQQPRVARRGLWGPISDLALLVADSGTDQRPRVARRGLWGPISDLALLVADSGDRSATSRCSSRTLGTDQRPRVARRGLWGPISSLALLVADSGDRSAASRCSSRTLGTDQRPRVARRGLSGPISDLALLVAGALRSAREGLVGIGQFPLVPFLKSVRSRVVSFLSRGRSSLLPSRNWSAVRCKRNARIVNRNVVSTGIIHREAFGMPR